MAQQNIINGYWVVAKDSLNAMFTEIYQFITSTNNSLSSLNTSLNTSNEKHTTNISDVTSVTSVCDIKYPSIFIKSTGRFYKYVASGASYVVDNNYILNTKDGGNTRFVSFDYIYELFVNNTINSSNDKFLSIIDTPINASSNCDSSFPAIFIKSKVDFYFYIASGTSYVVDGDKILNTKDGGNTRYVSFDYINNQKIESKIQGAHNIYPTIISTTSEVSTNCDSSYPLIYNLELQRFYKYIASGISYVVDNNYILNTKDGGNTRFVVVDYDNYIAFNKIFLNSIEYGLQIDIGVDNIKTLINQAKYDVLINKTGQTIQKGRPIKLSGYDSISGKFKASVFIPNNQTDPSLYAGISMNESLDGQIIVVASGGDIIGLNTNSFNIDDKLFASSTGTIINIKPNYPYYSKFIGIVKKKGISDGSIFIPEYSEDPTITQTIKDVVNGNGFVDISNMTLSYDKSIRTLTISGSFSYYNKSKLFIKTSINEQIIHNNLNDIYYVYYVDNVLTISNNNFDYSSQTPIAEIIFINNIATEFWDGEFGLIIDKRYDPIIDWKSKILFDSILGCFSNNGFDITGNYTEASGIGGLSSNTFGISSGSIVDNSSIIPISSIVDTDGVDPIYPIWYKNNSEWLFYKNNLPYLIKNGNLISNQIINDLGSFTELSINDSFINIFVLGNTIKTPGYEYSFIIGQKIFNNISEAILDNIYNQDLKGFPIKKLAPLYKITLRYNTSYSIASGKCRIEKISDDRGSRLIINDNGIFQPKHNYNKIESISHKASEILYDLISGLSSNNAQGITQELKNLIDNIPSVIGLISSDLTGFDEIDPIITIFDNLNRTLSVAPKNTNYNFRYKGTKFIKSAIENIQISDIKGWHFIYFNENGQLVDGSVDDFITKNVPVQALYWNKTNQKIIRKSLETHNMRRDRFLHRFLHTSIGTCYVDGFDISNIIIGDGSLIDHLQLSLSDGKIYDEDIDFDIINNNPQQLSKLNAPVLFFDDDDWNLTLSSSNPFISGTSLLSYNKISNGVGLQLDCLNDSFVVYILIASMDDDYPVLWVQGRNNYTSISHATQNIYNEYNEITSDDFPLIEYVPISAHIIQVSSSFTNSKKAKFVKNLYGDDYLDLRTNFKKNKFHKQHINWKSNEIIVSNVNSNGDFTNLYDAVDWFNKFGESDCLIKLLPGQYNIDKTITVNNINGYSCTIAGDGINSVYLNASLGLANNPIFDIHTKTFFNRIIIDGSKLSNYGDFPNEDGIKLSSALYIECKDVIVNRCNNGINLFNGSKLWLFDSDITNNTNNGIINSGSIITLQACDFINNNTAININNGSLINVEIVTSRFVVNTGQFGIKYNRLLTTYKSFSIINNTFNGIGTYLDGFDWTIQADSNIIVVGNIGNNINDNHPFSYIQFKNNPTTTVLTTSNVYYKVNGINTASQAVKMSIDNNKSTYLSDISKNLSIKITGSITATTNNRSLSVAIMKNGSILLEENEIRVVAGNFYYNFALNSKIQNVNKNDYFEVWVTCTSANGITIIIRDLQFIID